MADLHTYDPAKVVVTFNGLRLTGIQKVTVKRDEDAVMKHVSTDGTVTRAINRHRGGEVTVDIVQSSPTNDILSAFAQDDEDLALLTGVLQVEDLFGTTLEYAGHAWIKKTPDSNFEKEVQDRAWVFDCAELRRFVGGSVV